MIDIIEFLILGIIIFILILRNTYLENEIEISRLEDKFDNLIKQLKDLKENK